MNRKYTLLEWAGIILLPIFVATTTLIVFDYFQLTIKSEITPGIITTLLALIAVLLAILGIGLSILAIWGFNNIKTGAIEAAKTAAKEAAKDEVRTELRYRIGKMVKDEIEDDENL